MGTESFPVFDGNDYETWRNMMKRLLIIYDLWGLVEKGYKAKAFRKSRKKKDSLAVEIILLAVDDSVRRCTLNANNSKQVWDAIQNKYHQVSRLSLSEQVDPSQDDAEGVGRDGGSNGFGCRLSRFSRESPAEASSFVSVVFVRLAAVVRLIGGDLETRSL
nr:calmodulin-like protein 9 [Ipomoea batatas]